VSGAQIDLLIDRRDHTVNLCETKFSDTTFNIDKRYADVLRNKAVSRDSLSQSISYSHAELGADGRDHGLIVIEG